MLFAKLNNNTNSEVLAVMRSCDTAKHVSTERTYRKKQQNAIISSMISHL